MMYFYFYLIGAVVSLIITFADTFFTYNKEGTARENSFFDCVFISIICSLMSWLMVIVWALDVIGDYGPKNLMRSINIMRGKWAITANDAYLIAVKKQGDLDKKAITEELNMVMHEITEATERGNCEVILERELREETKKKLQELGYTVTYKESNSRYSSMYDITPISISFNLSNPKK